jgi:hypothetical protein
VEEVIFGNHESRNPDKRRKNLERWIMGNQDRRSGHKWSSRFRILGEGERATSQIPRYMKSRCDLDCQSVGESGPLICGEEVHGFGLWDRGEELHHES